MTEAIVQTADGPKSLHVCKDGSAGNDDWVSVYLVSFPPSQRQDLGELKRQLADGSMELDETRDQDGNILCMTLSEVFRSAAGLDSPAFLLACYTAVTPRYRGIGIGSIHRRKLDSLLLEEYPSFLGIFSEIESTREPGLDRETQETRNRRKAFFLRLGLLPIDIDYLFPSYTPGGEPLMGELLWVPFSANSLSGRTLSAVLRRIYTEGYGLSEGAPLIERVLAPIEMERQY